MKLSWKIVLVVLLIVAVTVSAASYTMIASAFQAELDSQVSAAADESQMLCLTLGALAAQAGGNGEGSLREILNSSFFQNYRMIVYRQDGSVLWQNREEAAGLAPGDVGEEGICYMISVSFFLVCLRTRTNAVRVPGLLTVLYSRASARSKSWRLKCMSLPMCACVNIPRMATAVFCAVMM